MKNKAAQKLSNLRWNNPDHPERRAAGVKQLEDARKARKIRVKQPVHK